MVIVHIRKRPAGAGHIIWTCKKIAHCSCHRLGSMKEKGRERYRHWRELAKNTGNIQTGKPKRLKNQEQ